MSLEQELDSSSAAANRHVFRCPLAQFERRFIAERTRDAMNAARAKGAGPDDLRSIRRTLEATLLLLKGGMSPTKTARRTALGRSTLYREIQARGLCLPLAYVLEQILR